MELLLQERPLVSKFGVVQLLLTAGEGLLSSCHRPAQPSHCEHLRARQSVSFPARFWFSGALCHQPPPAPTLEASAMAVHVPPILASQASYDSSRGSEFRGSVSGSDPGGKKSANIRASHRLCFPAEPPFWEHPHDDDIVRIMTTGGLEMLVTHPETNWIPALVELKPAAFVGAAKRSFRLRLPPESRRGNCVGFRINPMVRKRWRHNWMLSVFPTHSTSGDPLISLHPHLPTISKQEHDHTSDMEMWLATREQLCDAIGEAEAGLFVPDPGSIEACWTSLFKLDVSRTKVHIVVRVFDGERSVPLFRSTYAPGFRWPLQSSCAPEAESEASAADFAAGKPFWESAQAPLPSGYVSFPTAVEEQPWFDYFPACQETANKNMPIFIGRVAVTIDRAQPGSALALTGPVTLAVLGCDERVFRDWKTRSAMQAKWFWSATITIPSDSNRGWCMPRRVAPFLRIVLVSPSPASLFLKDLDVRIAAGWGTSLQDSYAAALDLHGPRPMLGRRFPLPLSLSAGRGGSGELGPYEWITYRDFGLIASRFSAGLELVMQAAIGITGVPELDAASSQAEALRAEVEAGDVTSDASAPVSSAAVAVAPGGSAGTSASLIAPENRIFMGICADNCTHWLAAQCAALHGSFVEVAIMTTATQEVVNHIVTQTEMAVAVVARGLPLQRLAQAQRTLGHPEVIVVMDTTHADLPVADAKPFTMEHDGAVPIDVGTDGMPAGTRDGASAAPPAGPCIVTWSSVQACGANWLWLRGQEADAERLVRFPLPPLKQRFEAAAEVAAMSPFEQAEMRTLRDPDQLVGKGWASARAVTLGFVSTRADGSAPAPGSRTLAWSPGPGLGDLATVCYTSGSTGKPKGVQRSYRSSIGGILSFACPVPAVHFSMQTLAHQSEAHVLPNAITAGGTVGFWSGGGYDVYSDAKELEPTFLNIVPAFLNRLHALYEAALAVELAGRPSQERAAAEAKVLSEFSTVLGTRLQSIGVGSAPVTPSVIGWAKRCFIDTYIGEGYGSTECGTISLDNKMVADIEWRLEDVPELGYSASASPPRGEILVKTKHSSEGYFRNEEATSTAMTDDGFFHTGDIGELQPDGTVLIIGRCKFVTKLANGEFVSPERVETVLGESPLVDQLYVHADGAQYGLVAIVVPVQEALVAAVRADVDASAGKAPAAADAAAAGGTSSAQGEVLDWDEAVGVCRSARAARVIRRSLADAATAAGLVHYEAPTAVFVETSLRFSPENDLMTASSKPNRAGLCKRYATTAAVLYAGEVLGSDAVEAAAAEVAVKGAVAAKPTLTDGSEGVAGLIRATVRRLVTETLGVDSGDLVRALGSDSLRLASLSGVVGKSLGVDLTAALHRASTVSELVDVIATDVLLARGIDPETEGLTSSPGEGKEDAADAGAAGGLSGAALRATRDGEAVAGWAQAALKGGAPWRAGAGPRVAEDAPAEVQTRVTTADANTVLLTGVTGFLGVHLLVQLLRVTCKRVVVLARAPSQAGASNSVSETDRSSSGGAATAMGRLSRGDKAVGATGGRADASAAANAAARVRVLRAVADTCVGLPLGWESRVKVLAGDLGEERLGLNDADWARLRDDESLAVVHCGAHVNWVMRYEQLRAPNVLGTLELLLLAAGGRAAHPVHFVSTVGVADRPTPAAAGAGGSGADESTTMPFATVIEGLEHGQGGYGASKWVAERAVLVAGGCAPENVHAPPSRPALPASGKLESAPTAEAGLFVSVHRPGMITAHTLTGHSNANDYVNRILTACVQLKVCIAGPLPDHARLDMTPVDYVSGAIVALATAHGARNADGSMSASGNMCGSVYQYVNTAGSPKFDQVGVWVGEAGYECTALPYAEFSSALRAMAADTKHALVPLLAYFPLAASFPASIGMQVWGDASTRAALELLSHDPAREGAARAGGSANALAPTFSAASSVAGASTVAHLPEAGVPIRSRLVLRPPAVTAAVIRRTLVSLAVRGHAPAPPAAVAMGTAALDEADEDDEELGSPEAGESRRGVSAPAPAASASAATALACRSRGGGLSRRASSRVPSGAAPTTGEAVFGRHTSQGAVLGSTASVNAADVDDSAAVSGVPAPAAPTQATTYAREVRASNRRLLAQLSSAVEANPGVDLAVLLRDL